MKKRYCCILSLFLSINLLYSDPPENYYATAIGKKTSELQEALSNIISKAGVSSYNGLYDIYLEADQRLDGKVWDMYSDMTNFVFVKDQCGNYAQEGDCFNREHSVPQSWFDKRSPMLTDAYHVLPTDGKVNGMRSNFPFGEVASPSYQSHNSFSKLGSSAISGYNGTVFEPNDMYKGDIARIYFYMATRYMDDVGNWSSKNVFSSQYPYLGSWTLSMMLKWHRIDPVSNKERVRNDAIFNSVQKNRNPFVDYPELVELIFGNRQGNTFNPDETIPPIEEFKALEASEITAQSFVANWIKKSDADDYELSVYKKIEQDTSTYTIFDYNLDINTLPSGWSTNGYTSYENNGWRLASGSKIGSLIIPLDDLSTKHQLIIQAKPYKDDVPSLYIYLNDADKPVHTISFKANESRTDIIELKELGNNPKIRLQANSGKRVIITHIKLISTSETNLRYINGYPVRTGNVNAYTVDNLKGNSTYYYTVTPYSDSIAGNISDEIKVITPNPDSIEPIDSEIPIFIYVKNNILHITNAPFHAQVSIFSISGSLIHQFRIIEQDEQIHLGSEGVYLIDITTDSFHERQKVTVY